MDFPRGNFPGARMRPPPGPGTGITGRFNLPPGPPQGHFPRFPDNNMGGFHGRPRFPVARQPFHDSFIPPNNSFQNQNVYQNIPPSNFHSPSRGPRPDIHYSDRPCVNMNHSQQQFANESNAIMHPHGDQTPIFPPQVQRLHISMEQQHEQVSTFHDTATLNQNDNEERTKHDDKLWIENWVKKLHETSKKEEKESDINVRYCHCPSFTQLCIMKSLSFNFNLILPKINTDYIRQAQVSKMDINQAYIYNIFIMTYDKSDGIVSFLTASLTKQLNFTTKCYFFADPHCTA